jgi:hypothetical protein
LPLSDHFPEAGKQNNFSELQIAFLHEILVGGDAKKNDREHSG